MQASGRARLRRQTRRTAPRSLRRPRRSARHRLICSNRAASRMVRTPENRRARLRPRTLAGRPRQNRKRNRQSGPADSHQQIMAQGRLQHGQNRGGPNTRGASPCRARVNSQSLKPPLGLRLMMKSSASRVLPIRHRIGAKAGGFRRSKSAELPSLEDHRSLQRQRQCQHVMRQRHEPVDPRSDFAGRSAPARHAPVDRARQYGNRQRSGLAHQQLSSRLLQAFPTRRLQPAFVNLPSSSRARQVPQVPVAHS